MPVRVKIVKNFRSPKTLVDDLKVRAAKKMDKIAEKIAQDIESKSGGEVKPIIVTPDGKDEHSKVILVADPTKKDIIREQGIFKRTWEEVPGIITDGFK